MADDSPTQETQSAGSGLDLPRLIPHLLEPYLGFFRKSHEEGVVPCRIKELARLKIAALNDCDT